jgi:hypothetical protein
MKILVELPRSKILGKENFCAHEVSEVLKTTGNYGSTLPTVSTELPFLFGMNAALAVLQTDLFKSGALTSPRTWPSSSASALAAAFKTALLKGKAPVDISDACDEENELAHAFLGLATSDSQAARAMASITSLVLEGAEAEFASSRPEVQMDELQKALAAHDEFESVRKIKSIGAPGTLSGDRLETLFFRAHQAKSKSAKTADKQPESSKTAFGAGASNAIFMGMPDNSGSSIELELKRTLRNDAIETQGLSEWRRVAATSDIKSLFTSVSAPAGSAHALENECVTRLLTSDRDVDVAITGVAGTPLLLTQSTLTQSTLTQSEFARPPKPQRPKGRGRTLIRSLLGTTVTTTPGSPPGSSHAALGNAPRCSHKALTHRALTHSAPNPRPTTNSGTPHVGAELCTDPRPPRHRLHTEPLITLWLLPHRTREISRRHAHAALSSPQPSPRDQLTHNGTRAEGSTHNEYHTSKGRITKCPPTI